ncbi:MAG: LacI family DNA-binding transcriptional regulator [Lentisphaeria bacterium]|nr:LacI family DNA-binding transcriptional regulator [Lentisphaeria bacterium]
MKKALQKDIAETMGISISQVSRALNHQGRVSDDTRNRVLRLAKKMKYRNFSNRHRKRIAILADNFCNFNVRILEQFRLKSEKMKFSFHVIPTADLKKFDDLLFDGAVLISHGSEQAKWCEKFKIPLVVINHYGDPLENIASVFSDADHEVRTAMTHFIGLGHKKIARICFISLTTSNKIRGTDEFYRVAEENGIRNQVFSSYVRDSKEELIEKILRLADEGFTAFLVIINDLAPYLLNALRRSGRRIPEDISLITYEYDNAAYLDPPLTTIEYNYEQLVRKAIEQLKNEIAGKKIIPKIQIPCKLNIRNSTAAPPQKRDLPRGTARRH